MTVKHTHTIVTLLANSWNAPIQPVSANEAGRYKPRGGRQDRYQPAARRERPRSQTPITNTRNQYQPVARDLNTEQTFASRERPKLASSTNTRNQYQPAARDLDIDRTFASRDLETDKFFASRDLGIDRTFDIADLYEKLSDLEFQVQQNSEQLVTRQEFNQILSMLGGDREDFEGLEGHDMLVAFEDWLQEKDEEMNGAASKPKKRRNGSPSRRDTSQNVTVGHHCWMTFINIIIYYYYKYRTYAYILYDFEWTRI